MSSLTASAVTPGPTMEYNIKAWCCGGCSRPPSKRHDFGFDFEQRDDGHIYITRVEGLAKDFTEVKVGDRLYKFQDVDAVEYSSKGETGIAQLYDILKDALKITIETLHPQDMSKEIKMEDLPVEKGDVVPLTNYPEKPELEGHQVEVLRKLQKGKLLVSPVGRKEKLLVTASNLDFEIELDKLVLKDRGEDSDSDNDNDNDDEEEEGKEAEKEEEEDDNGEEEQKEAKETEEATPAAEEPAPAVAIEAA